MSESTIATGATPPAELFVALLVRPETTAAAFAALARRLDKDALFALTGVTTSMREGLAAGDPFVTGHGWGDGDRDRLGAAFAALGAEAERRGLAGSVAAFVAGARDAAEAGARREAGC